MGNIELISQDNSSIAKLLNDSNNAIDIPKPFSQEILLLEGIHIAGTTHIDDIESKISCLEIGSKLRLQRDKDNAQDCWAIKVFTKQSKRIGWIPTDCNDVIARLMDAGKDVYAKVTNIELRCNWHKIDIEVFLSD